MQLPARVTSGVRDDELVWVNPKVLLGRGEDLKPLVGRPDTFGALYMLLS